MRRSARRTGTDYRITDDDDLGEGSTRRKFNQNLAAIRLLKAIEAEGRTASPAEQATLVQYTGWGWAGSLFDDYDRQWRGERAELRELLTPEEFDAARATILNAHYTSKDVVEAVWEGVRGLGFEGGRVLEPGCGIGNFMGLVPQDVWEDTRFTGVEIDSITGRIAHQLYQSADVRNEPFEKTATPAGFYDLTIGNVPFGDYGVFDPAFETVDRRFLTKSIHNYFLAKSVESTRDGGVIAVVTSHHLMDGVKAKRIREWLAARCDLLAAVRLPNTAFEGNAHTKVTTDILFLRKRGSEAPSGETWADRHEIEPGGQGERGWQRGISVNEYYARHPEQIMGHMEIAAHGMYGAMEPTCAPVEGWQEKLREAMGRLPAGIITKAPHAATEPTGEPERMLAPANLQQAGWHVENGKLYVRVGEGLEERQTRGDEFQRIEGMLELRDATRDLLSSMATDGVSDEAVGEKQRALGALYDDFAARFGSLGSAENRRAFGHDPDATLVLQLEQKDRQTGAIRKADVFTKRTVSPHTPVTSAPDAATALTHALREHGSLHWDRIAGLVGKSVQDVQEELEDGGHVFHDPTGDYTVRDEYLSGNVREKLRVAEGAARHDPRYQRNVEALRAVQPPVLLPEDIDTPIGATWIPEGHYAEFMAHLVGGYNNPAKIERSVHDSDWHVRAEKWAAGLAESTSRWGTEAVPMHKLMEHALNGTLPTVRVPDPSDPSGKKRIVDRVATEAARDKLQAIREEWNTWVWSDNARADDLARRYNAAFNSTRNREYDGSHLDLPGMSAEWQGKMLPHQKNAVWRMVQSPTTLLAHVVGAGKTAQMTAAAMEMRRLGIAKKPMFVVPNHLVQQWANEIQQLYPSARVLMTTPEDFSPARRNALMSKIATGDWDAVLVAHSHFGAIPLSEATIKEHYEAELAERRAYLEETRGDSSRSQQKRIEKGIKRLEAELERKIAKLKSGNMPVTFEQLGVDQVFVDEAHLYKQLGVKTKMQNVAGIPSGEGSQRAFDMWMKTRWLMKRNGGRGVVFATGTPVSNSIAEMFVMQRYLQEPRLKELGIRTFDDWAKQFGEVSSADEMSADGRGYKQKTRFRRFVNVPELSTLFGETADVKTREDLNLPVPEHTRHMVMSKPTPEQTAYVRRLGERASAVLGEGGRRVDPSEDNMLKIASDGRKAALDIRLVDPSAPDNPDSKVNKAVANIRRIWEESAGTRGIQTVFLDLGTPKATDPKDVESDGPMEQKETAEEAGLRGSVYADIKRKLIAAGVPADEIAFIHDAKDSTAKAKLFEAMNDGRVRVVLGSTEKMGTGMNAQRRMIALHHLDCPWRPCDLDQREGRILRSGNTNPHVHIYSYATEGVMKPGTNETAMSFDTFMWQTVETKARAINEIMAGKYDGRRADDVDMAIHASQMKAISTGNEAMQRHSTLTREVRQLEALHKAHQREMTRATVATTQWPSQREELDRHATALETAASVVAANRPSKGFEIEIGTHRYSEAGDGGEQVNRYAATLKDGESKRVGRFCGMTVEVAKARGSEPVVRLARDPDKAEAGDDLWLAVPLGESGRGTAQRMTNLVGRISEMAKEKRQAVSQGDSEIAVMQHALTPFAKRDLLTAKRKELAGVERELGLLKDDTGYDGPEGAEDDDVEKALVLRVWLRKGVFAQLAGQHPAGTPIDHTNYHEDTVATWRKAKTPDRRPDYESRDKISGKVRSRYWHGRHGVYRESDHWSNDRQSAHKESGTVGHIGQGSWNEYGCRWDHEVPSVVGHVRTGYTRYDGMQAHPQKAAAYRWLKGNRPEVAETYKALPSELEKAVTLNRRTGRMRGNPTYMEDKFRAAWPARSLLEKPYQSARAMVRYRPLQPRAVRSHIAGIKDEIARTRAATGEARGGWNAAMLARGHAKLKQGAAKSPTASPTSPAPVMGAEHLHSAALGLGMSHAASRPRKSGFFGRRTEGQEHLYHHRNPLRSAQSMRASLAQTHTVSGVRQLRVIGADGRIRHSYTFHAAPKGGGHGHYVTIMRGA